MSEMSKEARPEAYREMQYSPWSADRERHTLEMNSHGLADTHSVFDAIYELKATRMELEIARGRQEAIRTALEAARHELSTLHGLYAFDGEAPEETWRLDTTQVVGLIDDLAPKGEGEG